MNLEEQVKLYKDLCYKIEELEEQKKLLSLSIRQAMQGKALKLAGFQIRRCSRLSIQLTLEEARSLNAIKLEEVVDKDKIKALYKEGQAIKGVSEIEYIQVTSNL